jgi:F-type H+-transporting ATPase subunit gamma
MANQARFAATMKAVKIRMRSVKNIQKITKAMKMVAAAKLRHDQRRMDIGLPFVRPVQNLFQRLPQSDRPDKGPVTMLTVCSDKGLCGGINTFATKATRLNLLEYEASGLPVKVMIAGSKGTAAMQRLFADRFTVSISEAANKFPVNFTSACAIMERIVRANPERIRLTYNQFISVMSYDTKTVELLTKNQVEQFDKMEVSKALDVYSFEPPTTECWDDLHEFYYACSFYGAWLQSATSEQSSRMSAMENASKNAGEMFNALELQYNRARQAKITTELCEIISGASAV